MSKSRRESSQKKFDILGNVICSCGCGRPPGPGRRNWHSQECVDSWLLRNNPGTIRKLLFKRDRGVCSKCEINASSEFKRLKSCRSEVSRYARWWQASGLWGQVGVNFNQKRFQKDFNAYLKVVFPGWSLGRSTGWDAHHILPVIEGGGQCGLSNLTTLCHPCHKEETKRLNQRPFSKTSK